MIAPIAEIKLINTEYYAFLHGKEISRGKSLVKVTKALAAFVKGQQ